MSSSLNISVAIPHNKAFEDRTVPLTIPLQNVRYLSATRSFYYCVDVMIIFTYIHNLLLLSSTYHPPHHMQPKMVSQTLSPYFIVPQLTHSRLSLWLHHQPFVAAK